MENRTIEQMAADFAGDRSLGAGHGYPNFTADMLAKGFREGYKSALKNNKDQSDTIAENLEKLRKEPN